jgi:hypothetical protein
MALARLVLQQPARALAVGLRAISLSAARSSSLRPRFAPELVLGVATRVQRAQADDGDGWAAQGRAPIPQQIARQHRSVPEDGPLLPA